MKNSCLNASRSSERIAIKESLLLFKQQFGGLEKADQEFVNREKLEVRDKKLIKRRENKEPQSLRKNRKQIFSKVNSQYENDPTTSQNHAMAAGPTTVFHPELAYQEYYIPNIEKYRFDLMAHKSIQDQSTKEVAKALAGIRKKKTVKITSWNLWLAKDLENCSQELFRNESDIICFQGLEKRFLKTLRLKGYSLGWNFGDQAYFGIAIASKLKLTAAKLVKSDLGSENFRHTLLRWEFSKFQLICVQSPPAGLALDNLQEKLTWQDQFNDYISFIKKNNKPIIIAGSLETALLDIGNVLDLDWIKIVHFQPFFYFQNSTLL